MAGVQVRVAYFVHDLSDPAVLRRLRMLHAAGAEAIVLGFRRTPSAPHVLEGAPAVDLGRTFDGRLTQRALGVMRQLVRAPRLGKAVRGCDVVIGRTLEALVLAHAVRRLHAPRARLVYECLDVHRLMTSKSWAGRGLRWLEQSLLARSDLLILSSPGHLRAYFSPWQGVGRKLRVPVLMLENKVVELDGRAPLRRPRRPGPPWRIGWYGMLRCRKSLETLCRTARAHPDMVQVVIRGRPSEHALPDLTSRVAAAAPAVQFAGGYSGDELAELYADVHFTWAIDHSEEGANSEWLLPNRIYEGGRYGAVPIALRRAETGRWLEERGLGVLLDDPSSELGPLLQSLDQERYRTLEGASLAASPEWFTAGPADCERLVRALAGAAP